MNATVEAGLPEECTISSYGTLSVLRSDSRGKNKRGNNDFVDAIPQLNNSSLEIELAKYKLIYMEKEESRPQQEEIRCQ